MTAVAVLGGLVTAEALAMTPLRLPDLQETRPVPVGRVDTTPAGPDDAAADARRHAPEVTWPAPGVVTAALPSEGRDRSLAPGGLPLTLRSPGGPAAAPAGGDLRVEVLGRDAAERVGVDGPLLAAETPAGTGGETELTVDYSGFREASGAGWASRLRLVRLPECALTTPEAPECRPEPVAGARNDVRAGTVTGRIALPAPVPVAGTWATGAPASSTPVRTLYALRAAPAGPDGDFKASSLSPSGTWQSGSSSGAFTWTYPMGLPPVPGEVAPDLALNYNSASLDGRTAATNNQANNVGDGWTLEPGFVERRYRSCNEDMKGGNNKAKNGEQCWATDNAVLSLNGFSNELVKDDRTGTWKLLKDDGSRIERIKDPARDNGTHEGEYWKLTDAGGTQYFFGYHKLPGWTSGKPTTDSAWTVPVYGNHAGEPGHKPAFADSMTRQGWRWNLDWVVDPRGDAMAYHWAKESNRYGRNVNASTGASTNTEYTRGGYLKRIEYGLRADTALAGTPAARVTLNTAERCLPGKDFDCAEAKFTKENAKHWPDVPFDQYCKAGENCKNRHSPSFWTRKRITGITSEVRVGAAYRKVDSWALTHQFPSPGDGASPALWLASVTRTGHTGGKDLAMPPVTFSGKQLENRVDRTGDGIPPLIRYRVRGINTESGGTVAVDYSAPECTPASLPAEESNTKRCYPVWWNSPDAPGADSKPLKDWFHTYVVTGIREEDRVGGAPPKRTDYTYLGGAAWAKSEDEFAKPEHRSHSQFRGYGQVRTTEGDGKDGPRAHTEKRFFRGLTGKQVPDSEGVNLPDAPPLAGMQREETTHLAGAVLDGTSATPWTSAPTATRARPGLPDLTARITKPDAVIAERRLQGSAWQRARVERGYDAQGQVVTESDLGDLAVTGDETCTTTTYARNPALNILDLAASVKKVAKACGITPNLPADLISEHRTYFDGSTTLGAAPTKGDTTRADEQNAAGTGFVTVETHKTDRHGRAVETVGAAGAKSTAVFTPAHTDAPTSLVARNALGHTETSEYDPGRGEPIAKIDANGKRQDADLDPLGRVARVWEKGWSKAANPDAPSLEYVYTVSRTAPSSVAARHLRHTGEYRTEYTLYDGLLRERETQVPSANGSGRVVTEKKYDSRGLEWKVYKEYLATGEPSATLVTADDTKVPHLTRTEHDGAGRPVLQIAEKYGDERSRVTTRYDGGRTTVIPPAGGTPTATVTDLRDNVVERVEYADTGLKVGHSTRYTYTPSGEQASVTDPTGARWTFTYDKRDRVVKEDDPDKGVTTHTYDAADRRVTSTGAGGATLTTGYDPLGRRTSLKQGATTLAGWEYDAVAKGEQHRAVRRVGGQDYVVETTGLDGRDQPTGTRVTIPAREGGLAGSYELTHGYNARTGLLEWTRHPAFAGQTAERVTHRYSTSLPYDQVVSTVGGSGTLVANMTYDPFQRVLRTEYGSAGRKVWESNEYDEHTGHLTRVVTDRETGPSRIDDTRYGFDQAGNITGVTTESGQDGGKSVDTQCFTLDGLRRVTNAWTATDGCAAKPNADGTPGGTTPKVGGPDAYWHSFTYDAIGNRRTETQHAAPGNPTATTDLVRSYAYGENGAGTRALTSVTTKSAGQKDRKDTYGFDKAGNTTARQVGGRAQDLAWDAEGRLARVTENNLTTHYTYDADGARILAADPTGTTLTLPGGNQIRMDAKGAKAGTRYYAQGDKTVATKTGGQTSILLSDHHGTASVAVLLGAGQAVTRRKKHIFGNPRTAQPGNWPGNQGFVGGTMDGTGLTHLGAREYDPTLGRFISVDPVIDTADPQQMHGYTYGNNNPLVQSDPDGKFFGALKNWISDVRRKAEEAYRAFMRWMAILRARWEAERRAAEARARAAEAARKAREAREAAERARKAAERKAREDAQRRAKQAREAAEKRRKAQEQKKKDNRSGLRKLWDKGVAKAGGAIKKHWRGAAEIAAFGVCVAASAGACIVAGAAVAGAKWFASSRDPNTKKYGAGDFFRETGIGVLGGAAGAAIGKGVTRGLGGNTTFWRAGMGNAVSSKGAERYMNMSINAKMSVAGCGIGGFSPSYCS
ncbi:RHS repeat domain-containing protein [Streptomyces sp. BI20]|uniref:RHS repeat domain-containing protein n=1 Tax=Streptomyces sp. BI20 TaxID=3403460 RepID=UPI003C7404B1